MTAHRISVKYFVEDPDSVELAAYVPIFQRWIQQHSVEGLLIDVVDYKHVHNGPGVLLISHEADYSLDMARGRPGLLYTRKRDIEDIAAEASAAETELADILPTLLRNALIACRLLQEEPVLAGAVNFRTDEVEVTFLDRLRLPNQAQSLEAVRGDVEAVIKQLYASDSVTIKPLHDDPRQPLALSISVPATPIETLLSRLGSSVPTAGLIVAGSLQPDEVVRAFR